MSKNKGKTQAEILDDILKDRHQIDAKYRRGYFDGDGVWVDVAQDFDQLRQSVDEIERYLRS